MSAFANERVVSALSGLETNDTALGVLAAILFELRLLNQQQPRISDATGRQNVIVDSLPTLASVTAVTGITNLGSGATSKPADTVPFDLSHISADGLYTKIIRS